MLEIHILSDDDVRHISKVDRTIQDSLRERILSLLRSGQGKHIKPEIDSKLNALYDILCSAKGPLPLSELTAAYGGHFGSTLILKLRRHIKIAGKHNLIKSRLGYVLAPLASLPPS
jgi:hypothetical protein